MKINQWLRCDKCDCKYLGIPALNQLCENCNKQKKSNWNKDFEKNYLEYSDSGVLVKYIGENGIDIDDYIQQKLDEKDKEIENKIDSMKVNLDNLDGSLDSIKFTTAYNQAIEDIKNNIK